MRNSLPHLSGRLFSSDLLLEMLVVSWRLEMALHCSLRTCLCYVWFSRDTGPGVGTSDSRLSRGDSFSSGV